MEKLKLEIELVPKPLWYANLRSELSKDVWQAVSRDCAKRHNYQCGICGGKGAFHPVECHEIWQYDDVNRIQTLTGIISLCPNCHRVKHFGLAYSRGETAEVFAHFCKINNLSEVVGELQVQYYFDLWSKRSAFDDWQADMSWVNKLLAELPANLNQRWE